jgi:hypothetical protein
MITRGRADEHTRRGRDSTRNGDRLRNTERRADTSVAIRPRGTCAGDLELQPRGDGTDNRAQYGRVAGMTDHMDVLRYAAGVCAAGYQPGTIQRGMLEQFAAGDMA